MDANSVTNALQSQGIKAFGLAMPILAQDWVDSGGGTPSVDDTVDPLKITLASGNWAAPCTTAIQIIDPSTGATMPVTLLNSYGLAQMDAVGAPPGSGTTPPAPGGVLLTMFETAWLRLCWLYANVLETASTAQPQQANGLPCRQVPRYFFYPTQTTFPGQTTNQTSGIADAGISLGFGGDLWIFDNDGLPIDSVAVIAAFNALMTKFQLLQAGTPSASPALGNYLSSLASTSGTRVRLVGPDGTPATGASGLLTNLTAVSGAPAVGVFSVAASTAIGVQSTGSGSGQPPAGHTVFGPATSGALTTSFTPPAPASGITLQRDFFTLRLVALNAYLIGAANPADPAASVTPPIPVRINETISLLAAGNDVMGAVGQALAGANPTLAVAQVLDGAFSLPTAPGTAAAWPTFPGNATVSASAALPMAWSPALTVTAVFANPNAADATKADVTVTLAGFPVGAAAKPDMTGAWIRLYPRRFGVNAAALRGDGQGRAVPSSGTLAIYLTDPLGLAMPGLTAAQIVVPPNATLNFDMIGVLPNQSARIYGGLSCNITQGGSVAAPSFNPGTNGTTTATFQGVCHAGILGLGTASSGPPPTSLAGWAEALTGETTPRDASRLPTMARRELLAAGLKGGKWTGVIGGGRIAKEAVCALPRLGEPGGYGGRETIVTGAETSGGPLAYDIARHALRRAQNIIGRVATLGQSAWSEPAALPALSPGQTSGNSGTFAGAVLQNIAPFCETPELEPVLDNFSLAQAVAQVISQGNLVTEGSSTLASALGGSTDITNALNTLAGDLGTAISGAPMQIAAEVIRELSSATYGRRDTQWALGSALNTARHFVYIETPGFCSTMDTTKPATSATPAGSTPPPWPPTYALDLIALLQNRLSMLPGLRVIICVPKYADFATGYETLAADEVQDRYNILIGMPGATPPIPFQLSPAQTVSFHPIGFPGRYSRVESHVVIVDNSWALVGGSSFRRRGLAFDGSSDLVLTDTQVVNGRSPSIRDFRRALMATRLGIPVDADHPSYVQLYDGRQSFDLVRSTLQAGGLGKIDLMWNGQTPGVTTPTVDPTAQPSPIDLSNPDGRNFSPVVAGIVAALAASSSGP